MNKIETDIITLVLAEYEEEKMLTHKSVEKLKQKMISGRMKSEDWISIFDNDRPDTKDGQNEDR